MKTSIKGPIMFAFIFKSVMLDISKMEMYAPNAPVISLSLQQEMPQAVKERVIMLRLCPMRAIQLAVICFFILLKQECIPAGCVTPSTVSAQVGVCLGEGVCPGEGICLEGCVCPRGCLLGVRLGVSD